LIDEWQAETEGHNQYKLWSVTRPLGTFGGRLQFDEQSIDDQSEFDFYISANRESASAQEVAQVLRETGYSVYFPVRNNKEAEADRIAVNRAKGIVLILTKDSEQTQSDLDELLNILSTGGAERRVIILQFEECEIASLLDRNFITNLVGLNSHNRALHILASASQGLQNNLPTHANGQLASAARSHRVESRPHSDWAAAREVDNHQKSSASSADEETELRIPPVRLRRIVPAPPMPAPVDFSHRYMRLLAN
jgi:hypothetical protein